MTEPISSASAAAVADFVRALPAPRNLAEQLGVPRLGGGAAVIAGDLPTLRRVTGERRLSHPTPLPWGDAAGETLARVAEEIAGARDTLAPARVEALGQAAPMRNFRQAPAGWEDAK
jgi:hypothetical protein